MAGVGLPQKVYRLRKLPNHISSTGEAAQLLADALDTTADSIIIQSLAKTSDRWERLPSKVATLQFKNLPEHLQRDADRNQWELTLPSVNHDSLILDTHFKGLTVLNDLEPSEHHSDCIAISGLASHPFGSWQPHGLNKSYMWIRDELPKSVPGVRFILYGYESTLAGSDSFQSISDIGLGLAHQLGSGGWNLSSSKPIAFLAHSLGGLVLKEALVQLADRDTSISSVLLNIHGAIMFGVPSLGMQQSHLMAVVKGQANESLIQDLSRDNGSSYLRKLNKSFEGISCIRTARIFWAYETKESKTVVRRPDGSWDRNGPLDVLVNPDSATSGHNHNSKSKGYTIPINEDHTNMVKFVKGDPNLGTIISILLDLCGQNHQCLGIGSSAAPSSQKDLSNSSPTLKRQPHLGVLGSTQDDAALKELDAIFMSLQELHQEIYSPELDFRLDQIEDAFEDTFKWIYNIPSFCKWLQSGSGLFWIHGKPASGKSTLMKFIIRNQHTWELLHDWKRNSYELKTSFFFHYRGTSLQKSFEGVLRSLIIQVLAPHYENFQKLHKATWLEYQKLVRKKKLYDQNVKKIKHEIESKSSLSARQIVRNTAQENEQLKIEIGELAAKRRTLETKIEIILIQFSVLEERFKPYLGAAETQLLKAIVDDFRDNRNGLIAKLEKLLFRLLNQSTMSMDAILFFDALDEFDGHLHMIIRFIEGLTKVSSTSAMRVKVCFSSRPWTTLQTHFAASPNISLQDYTTQDIEDYTASSLTAASVNNRFIMVLVPEIRTRANGVFLWVRLAVNELLLAISTSPSETSLEELRMSLQKLPNDLKSFYDLIIERLNKQNRHQTYYLLELLARQREPATAWDIRRVVLISGCSTYLEAHNELAKDEQMLPSHFDSQHTSDRVRTDILTWSGGLVEIHNNVPQFMHQTVLEFVTGLSFKKSVFGHLAAIFTENGYSFHFKYSIFQGRVGGGFAQINSWEQRLKQRHIGSYAEQSELTTGNSQLTFISSIPDVVLRRLIQTTIVAKMSYTILQFIMVNRLVLCLADWIAANPSQLRSIASRPATSYGLLSSVLWMPCPEKYAESLYTMVRILVENGYSLEADIGFFPELLRMMWLPHNQAIDWFPSTIRQRLLEFVLEYIQDPNAPIEIIDDTGKQLIKCTPMHIASADAVAPLVARGATVNSQDIQGKTPVDWMVVVPHNLETAWKSEWDWTKRYNKCRALLDQGGTSSRHTTRTDWEKALDEFDTVGCDTQTLRAQVRGIPQETWGRRIWELFTFGP